MSHPIPHLKYRIQSIDFLTYLELSVPSAASATSDVGLRPAKQTDCQYWQFEKDPNSTGYFVRNVANRKQCLSLLSSTQSVYASAASTFNAATIVNVSYHNGTYQLAFYKNYYFYTDDSTTVKVKTSTNDLDKQKWRLVPVTSQPIYKHVLQSGNYRIRNLNGKSLLTMPDGKSKGNTNVYVRPQLKQSPYQRWTVTRQDSGQYTIQNASDSLYLGWDTTSATVGNHIVGSEKICQWDLSSVGGYAWSLRIPSEEISMGVGNHEIEDGDEVSLVVSDNASSQIWFMEKYIPLGQDKIHAKREIPEGKYLLKSAVHGVCISLSQFPLHIGTGVKDSVPCPFELKYIDHTSALFTLAYTPNEDKTSLALMIADVGGHVGLSHEGLEFVLLEKDKGDPGYVICRPDSDRPFKVISARVMLDVDKRPVFAIDNRVVGSTTQMWTLVPAS